MTTPVPIPDGEAYRAASASWDDQALGLVVPPWAESTAAYWQIGRAGALTPAQLYRSNGGSLR